MRRSLKLLPVAIALLTSSTFAATLTVTESGTLSASTPTTAYSTPGGTYSFTFNVSSTPTVTASAAGLYFDPVISGFSYTLNGVTSTPAAGVGFFSTLAEGLLDVCFSAACSNSDPTSGLLIEGMQAYSGSESAPTILTGSYTPIFASFLAGGTEYVLTSESNVNITTAATTTTPEPSSIVLLGSGLLGLAGAARKRFARR